LGGLFDVYSVSLDLKRKKEGGGEEEGEMFSRLSGSD